MVARKIGLFLVLTSVLNCALAQSTSLNLIDGILTERSRELAQQAAKAAEKSQVPDYVQAANTLYPVRTLDTFLEGASAESFSNIWANRAGFFGHGWVDSGGLFNNSPPQGTLYVARSFIVAEVLRNTYKVQVPFNDEGWKKIFYSQPPLAAGLPSGQNQVDCGAITASFFAGGVWAMTEWERAKALMESRNRRVEGDSGDAKQYLSDLFQTLEHSCSDMPFVDAYKDFLSKVAQAIEKGRAEREKSDKDMNAKMRRDSPSIWLEREKGIWKLLSGLSSTIGLYIDPSKMIVDKNNKTIESYYLINFGSFNTYKKDGEQFSFKSIVVNYISDCLNGTIMKRKINWHEERFGNGKIKKSVGPNPVKMLDPNEDIDVKALADCRKYFR